MQALVEALQHLLTGAAESAWSLVAMGALAMGDALIPPLPSGTLVSALGATSAVGGPGSHPLWLIVVVAAACALLGDLLVYAVGHLLRGRPLQRLGGSRRLGPTISASERGLDSHWAVILGTARFVPVVRVGVFLAAGMFAVPLRRVVLMDGIAALSWASIYALGGHLGGALASSPLVGAGLGMAAGGAAGAIIAKVADAVQRSRLVDTDAENAPQAAHYNA